MLVTTNCDGSSAVGDIDDDEDSGNQSSISSTSNCNFDWKRVIVLLIQFTLGGYQIINTSHMTLSTLLILAVRHIYMDFMMT